jgi:hypothetical protein
MPVCHALEQRLRPDKIKPSPKVGQAARFPHLVPLQGHCPNRAMLQRFLGKNLYAWVSSEVPMEA